MSDTVKGPGLPRSGVTVTTTETVKGTPFVRGAVTTGAPPAAAEIVPPGAAPATSSDESGAPQRRTAPHFPIAKDTEGSSTDVAGGALEGGARAADPAAIADLHRLLDDARDWACLVGPQSAGKSIYAQYLAGFAPDEAHGWSLRSALERVAGGLHVAGVDASKAIPLLAAERVETAPPGRRFYLAPGTKEILHFAARGARRGAASDGDPQLRVHFFDVPGEWAQGWANRPPVEREPMERLLSRSRLFILFVPFWALLPTDWLATESALVGDALWSTSLPKSRTAGSWEPDLAALRVTAEKVHRDVEEWIDALWSCAPERFDVLLVLSQFQEDAVRAIYNRYRDGFGDGAWTRYEELLGRAAEPEIARGPFRQDRALASLVERLDDVQDAGIDLLRTCDDERRQRNLGASPALSALAQLIPFRDLAESNARRGRRQRARTVTIFPLNTLRLGKATLDRLSRPDEAHGLTDFRMCEDVVLWIALQLTAHRIWPL